MGWGGQLGGVGNCKIIYLINAKLSDSCYAGYYLDAESDCQECPVDEWSADAGDTACTPCPAGTHVGAGLGLAESDCTEGKFILVIWLHSLVYVLHNDK